MNLPVKLTWVHHPCSHEWRFTTPKPPFLGVKSDRYSDLAQNVVVFSEECQIYRKATELKLDRIAVRYLGTWPDDMALVL